MHCTSSVTQYTKGELLEDIQNAGLDMSFESFWKMDFFAQGNKKTSEKVHRARNRVLYIEARYKQWRKEIAYLKDIDAFDFVEAGIFIFRDLVPDEAHKEITSKHSSTGHKSSTLKQEMNEVENDHPKNKPVEGKKIASFGDGTHHSSDDTQYAYIWDTTVNEGYGAFIMTAKRVREDVDHEEDRQTKHRPDEIQENSADTCKSKGKGAKGGKSKGLNPDARMFFLWRREHAKAQRTSRWYVQKSVFGSWWNCLPILYGKGKGKASGKQESKGWSTKGLDKGKKKATVLDFYGPQLVTMLEGCKMLNPRGSTWDYPERVAPHWHVG